MQSNKSTPGATPTNTTPTGRRGSASTSRTPTSPAYAPLPLSSREAFLVAEVERAYTMLGSELATRSAARYGMPTEEPRSSDPLGSNESVYPPFSARTYASENEAERAYRNFATQLMARSYARFPMANEPRSWSVSEEFRGFEPASPGDFPFPSFGTRAPLADVEDEGESYRVHLELPGASKENVSVRVYDRSVEVRHAALPETGTRDSSDRIPLLAERSRGRFQRTLHLPEAVLAEKTEASFENGILELRLPKASPAPEIAIR